MNETLYELTNFLFGYTQGPVCIWKVRENGIEDLMCIYKLHSEYKTRKKVSMKKSNSSVFVFLWGYMGTTNLKCNCEFEKKMDIKIMF